MALYRDGGFGPKWQGRYAAPPAPPLAVIAAKGMFPQYLLSSNEKVSIETAALTLIASDSMQLCLMSLLDAVMGDKMTAGRPSWRPAKKGS